MWLPSSFLVSHPRVWQVALRNPLKAVELVGVSPRHFSSCSFECDAHVSSDAQQDDCAQTTTTITTATATTLLLLHPTKNAAINLKCSLRRQAPLRKRCHWKTLCASRTKRITEGARLKSIAARLTSETILSRTDRLHFPLESLYRRTLSMIWIIIVCCCSSLAVLIICKFLQNGRHFSYFRTNLFRRLTKDEQFSSTLANFIWNNFQCDQQLVSTSVFSIQWWTCDKNEFSQLTH